MDQNMTAPATPEQKIMATHDGSENSGFSAARPKRMAPYLLKAKQKHRRIKPIVNHR